MARIAGVNLPKEKRTEIGLMAIYGIGKSMSKYLCKLANVNPDTKIELLSEEEVARLREEIGKIATEGDLKRKQALDIKRLQEINCYRGIRHKKNLPVRGQRTRANARTKKGKKKTVANKKVVTK